MTKNKSRRAQRLREVIWRISIRYRGDAYRLRLFNRFASVLMDHLMVPASAKFMATVDANGNRGYVLHLDWQNEISMGYQLALRAYLQRKLVDHFGIDARRTNLEISMRDHRADLPIDEREITSAWLAEGIKRCLREAHERQIKDTKASADDWYQPVQKEAQDQIAQERERLERQRALRLQARARVQAAAQQAALRNEESPGRTTQGDDILLFRDVFTGFAGLWDSASANPTESTRAPQHEGSTQQLERRTG
jgi:hypothetical protein